MPTNTRKDATANYEVDKTIEHVRKPVGGVKRLSVAVVVNHRKVTDEKGLVSTQPLSEAEKTQITDLVKEAMGFSRERGDSVNVANSLCTEMATESWPLTASSKRTIGIDGSIGRSPDSRAERSSGLANRWARRSCCSLCLSSAASAR